MTKNHYEKIIELLVEELQRKDTTIWLLKTEVNKLKETIEKGEDNNG